MIDDRERDAGSVACGGKGFGGDIGREVARERGQEMRVGHAAGGGVVAEPDPGMDPGFETHVGAGRGRIGGEAAGGGLGRLDRAREGKCDRGGRGAAVGQAVEMEGGAVARGPVEPVARGRDHGDHARAFGHERVRVREVGCCERGLDDPEMLGVLVRQEVDAVAVHGRTHDVVILGGEKLPVRVMREHGVAMRGIECQFG